MTSKVTYKVRHLKQNPVEVWWSDWTTHSYERTVGSKKEHHEYVDLIRAKLEKEEGYAEFLGAEFRD